MKFVYVGKNIDVTPALKQCIEDKFKKLETYFKDVHSVKSVLSVQKNTQKIEVTVCLKKFDIRAEESNEDMYVAIDLVLDKLAKRLRRHKNKLIKKDHVSIRYDVIDDTKEEEASVCKRKHISLDSMTEEEALFQLEMLNHDFYIFKNEQGNVSVAYKRKDNDYGVIETI